MVSSFNCGRKRKARRAARKTGRVGAAVGTAGATGPPTPAVQKSYKSLKGESNAGRLDVSISSGEHNINSHGHTLLLPTVCPSRDACAAGTAVSPAGSVQETATGSFAGEPYHHHCDRWRS